MKTFKVLLLPILVGLGFFYAISGASASQSYLAEYWDTATVATPSMPVGAATVTTTVSEINFDWVTSSPAGIGADGFIARYTTTIGAGEYVFRLGSDDGARVYIDGTHILGAWIDQAYVTTSTVYAVPSGTHDLKIEFYENAGEARLAFSYTPTFASGLGTVGDPYQISTCEQLQNISAGGGAYLSKYFELTGNIDCATDTSIGGALYDNGYGFSPIGLTLTPFSGNFDGNGFTISGLNISRGSADYIGLFGYITGSVHDVKLTDVNISGSTRVGGLIGKLESIGSLTNSSVTGSITGNSYVGGLVGSAAAPISNSQASTTVTGYVQYIGGLVGVTLSNITNSYSKGQVTASDYGGDSGIGGLVGGISSAGSVSHSSSTANVSGYYAAGGLVGNADGSVTDSFASGIVYGHYQYVGGLIGYSSGVVSTTYATGKVTGYSDTGGLVGLSEGNIYDSYATGDVLNRNGDGNSYERAGGLAGGSSGIISNCYATGNVTSTDTYNGKVGGLVGGSSGQVLNSSSTGIVTGLASTGGLIGYLTSGTTTNSRSFGRVYGSTGVGGLIGSAFNSNISISYASGNVEATGDNAGGLVGYSRRNKISNTYATGNVSAPTKYSVGGLVGSNTTIIPDSITNSYTTGNVTGYDSVGGLVGANQNDDIRNSFAVGSLTSSGSYKGGIIGYDSTDPQDLTLYSNNYWFNSTDAGVGHIAVSSLYDSNWKKAASASVFQGDYSVAPFKVGATQNWDTSIWAFPSGQYPQLQVFFGSWSPTCSTIANASTYNAYPTCGVATCNSGYVLTDGACVAQSTGGSVAIVLPPGIGDGNGDSSATGLGATLQVGAITQSGTNVLTYISNTNNFSAPESGNGWNLGTHNFVITNLDLANYIATITFNSEPVTITLKKGESQNIDLDGDKVNDIRATFTDTFVNRAEITVKSLAKGAVATSTSVVNLIPIADVAVSNSASKITFLNNIVTNYQQGSKLKFDYRYPNEGVKSVSVRVTRQLVDSSGKVVKTLTVSKLIKPGIAFIGYVNENLAKNLLPGDYTVNIIIKDKVGNLLDQNGFAITVEKIKKKYFILNTELPAATDISFDEALWNKVKSDVLVPANPKFKFYYTNSSGIAHTVRMVRELIGPDGKVIEKKTGKWQMAVGETESLSFVQAIGAKLVPGNYQLKITASDFTTREVLAENSFGYTVESK